ncbi:MAG TPA: hypothetical protein VF824_08760 [Thermoanaerobaculia bacterium]
MRLRTLLFVLVLSSLAACAKDTRAINTIQGNPADTLPPMRALAPPAQVVIGDLRKPESALYDPEQDVYFISNVNGDMLTQDNNGFISRVDPKTFHLALKWIEGGKNGVTLDAPKGLAILGDTLYVSDVTGVRRFDRRTGAPRGIVALPGAVFINDLTTNGKDTVFVSDTGVRIGPGTTFIPTGTDAVWKIGGDRAEKIASGEDLKHPNGLDFVDGKLRVVTFGANELYVLDGGKKRDVVKLDGAQLDGLTHLADGTPIVSSWEANEIFRGGRGDTFHAILAGTDTPADIGYDATHHRLLVPHAGANYVTIHPLQ